MKVQLRTTLKSLNSISSFFEHTEVKLMQIRFLLFP